MGDNESKKGQPLGAGAAYLRAIEGDRESEQALAAARARIRLFRNGVEQLGVKPDQGSCLAALQSALLDLPTLRGAFEEAYEAERPYVEAALKAEEAEWASFGIEMPRCLDDWIVLASAAGMTFTEIGSASLDDIRLFAIGATRRAAFAASSPPTALTDGEAALMRALARCRGRRMLPLHIDVAAPAPADPKRLRRVLHGLHARGLVDYPKGSRAGVCITKLGLEALREYGTN